jgi:hypothetical protein
MVDRVQAQDLGDAGPVRLGDVLFLIVLTAYGVELLVKAFRRDLRA